MRRTKNQSQNVNDNAPDPESLVKRFSGLGGYPTEREGVLALAQMLVQVSNTARVRMIDIVNKCLNTGSFCPTPLDLRTVAGDIAALRESAKVANQHAQWERTYGRVEDNWPAKMSGLLVDAIDGKSSDEVAKVRAASIRYMLYYTEGDGVGRGDRAFWDGDMSNFGARNHDLLHFPELVNQIRAEGGWRTERELQQWESQQAAA